LIGKGGKQGLDTFLRKPNLEKQQSENKRKTQQQNNKIKRKDLKIVVVAGRVP